jgi:hypothetical protein
MLSDKAASDLDRGEGEWLNMQPVIRKAFKDNYDWLGTHQEAMEKLNHAFIKLSSKLESRVDSTELKEAVEKHVSGAFKKAAREDKSGDKIAQLSYELAKFNSLRVEIEKKVGKEDLQEQLRLKVDRTDTSIKQLFGNIVTSNLETMKSELETMRSEELENTETKLGQLGKDLTNTKDKFDKRLCEVEALHEVLEGVKNKFELYPSYSALHSMMDRKADKSTLDAALPQKADQQTFLDTLSAVEKTLAEHEKSLTILKLRAELSMDGQSRTYRTTNGNGPVGEISPVNASIKGEQERYMMGFTSGGDDSIMQVLPLSFRNETPGAKQATAAPAVTATGSKQQTSGTEESIRRHSSQAEAAKTASDSAHRAFNAAMSDVLGAGVASKGEQAAEPDRLLGKLSGSRSDAMMVTMWQRMNQMHDEVGRLREENVYLHNKLVQVDNAQYAQHFENIHRGEKERESVAKRESTELSEYATKTQVAELREAVAAESQRVDSLLVHTALVQRADEDLHGLKSKLTDYDLRLDSLSSSRDALDGKTQDLYNKLDHVSKRVHAHHENTSKRVDSCSSAIGKLSTETLSSFGESLNKLEKKVGEIDFESMRAHTLEGNQQERLRIRLSTLEKLTYSLETRIQAGWGATETVNVQTLTPSVTMPPAASSSSGNQQQQQTQQGVYHHPGGFQDRYQNVGRAINATSSSSSSGSPVGKNQQPHRSANSALDMRLARLQREKDELRRTLGLTFPESQ